jgi:hypothetical protein
MRERLRQKEKRKKEKIRGREREPYEIIITFLWKKETKEPLLLFGIRLFSFQIKFSKGFYSFDFTLIVLLVKTFDFYQKETRLELHMG